MIVIISPSKTFSNSKVRGNLKPLFYDKQLILRNKLKKLSIKDIIKEFKISEKLAIVVYNYYQNELEEVTAINLYEGVLYKELKQKEIHFEDNKLYIISALYGLLRPFDNISKYRLDFNNKILGNLYNYWQEDIYNYLNTNYKDEIIIDLTSKEFFPLISKLNNVYTINFIDSDNKRLSSVVLKQLRGSFANYIINKNIQTLEDVKQLKTKEFEYSKEHSNNKTLTFIRIKKI